MILSVVSRGQEFVGKFAFDSQHLISVLIRGKKSTTPRRLPRVVEECDRIRRIDLQLDEHATIDNQIRIMIADHDILIMHPHPLLDFRGAATSNQLNST